MHFITDRQTVDDLQLFGKGGGHSIYGLFDMTQTRGGASLLEQLFNEPLSVAGAIRKRIAIFRYFTDLRQAFSFSPEWFDQAEQYLANTDERTRLTEADGDWGRRISGLVAVNTEMAVIQKGIAALIAIAHACRRLVADIGEGDHPYAEDRAAMRLLLSGAAFETALRQTPGKRPSAGQAAELDDLLRFRHRAGVRKLLERIYYLDVYLTVARVAHSKGLAYPKVLDRSEHVIRLKDLYHPGLASPVANSIDITPENNVVFLTGANMAGKSTFMKSLGIAVYLGHMGFPVPAGEMTFSVLDGLFTTINLADNLSMGASHFYTEVLRVKKVAEELNKGRNLLVIFDELFRGTNVKDAYEGTLAITQAFASRRESIFVLSTHIIEAGAVLRDRCDNISFRYLPTILEGTHPRYTYQLAEGITDDRHGMIIIRNEGILDILQGGTEFAGTSFITDNQTLTDLNLLGKYRRGSIFSLFCKVQTLAGERMLDTMFRNPLDDAEAINRRSGLFRHFGLMQLSFPISGKAFEAMESYLDEDGPSNLMLSMARTIYRRAAASIAKAEAYDLFDAGLRAALQALRSAHVFLGELLARDADGPYSDRLREAARILEQGALGRIMKHGDPHRLGLPEMAALDYAIRTVFRDRLQRVRETLAELDVFIAVGNLGQANGWTYAVARPPESDSIDITGLRHPAVDQAVGNTITLDGRTNMLFLTGANMAGKSTFMKSFGIAVYLAHMGFPVAADRMSFSIREGLFSSINMADDLEQGHSHFYAEVLRVKHVAGSVAAGKRLVVLFDELFKGTNVKDAYDGTLAVAEAFASYRQCLFIISTHIVEVGEALVRGRGNIRSAYLPTIMEGNKPRYTYVMREGIAADRIGMMIIENEGILDIIKK
jgi:DNA mismatch repair ATPase MutS